MSTVRLLLQFLLCWAVLGGAPAFAVDEKKIEASTDQFCESPHYVSGWCHDNVLQLLERGALSFSELLEARVLIVIPTSSDSTLASFATGHGTKLWRYHVILELHNRIYDSSMEVPRSLDLNAYLKRMFHIEKPEQKMDILSIPALDYFNEMGRLDPDGNSVSIAYYLNSSMAKSRYERKNAKDLTAGAALPQKQSIYSSIKEDMPRLVVSHREDALIWRQWSAIVTVWVYTQQIDVKGAEREKIVPKALRNIEERAERDPLFQKILRRYQASRYESYGDDCRGFLD